MRKPSSLLLILIALIVSGSVLTAAQSRRVPPGSSGKSNTRPTEPTPTPPISTDEDLPADADQSDDIITVETRLVTIPVRILDRNGRFVGGLERSSFKVFEDNIEQEIAYFSNESQPFTVVLVLDMSYSAKFKAAEIQSAALSFIDQLRPKDTVMVISFAEEVQIHCEPTSDRREIYRAIRQTEIATGTSVYEAVDVAMNVRLRDIEGRKAIVLFTDGVDTTSRRAHDLGNLRDAMELDALIYPIRYDTFNDVQRMKNQPVVMLPDARTKGTPPIAGGNKTGLPFPIPGPVVGTPSDVGTTQEEYDRAEEYLDQLALRTGGRMYVADTLGNLNTAFSRIASELREFYSIGYYPDEDERKNKNRKIKVRVDKPNVAVRARDSYVVPDSQARR
ncbi:MAG TPA: VWA domain-containing protein [Pyrinomonadaceae bacterium]|nr:VWA domain-containing protein [Pyrinomonadaceae bacterium]